MKLSGTLRGCVVLAVLASGLARPPSAPAQVFLRGDSTSDGQVNIFDGGYTLCYLFGGGQPPGCLDAADANNDTAINISDVTLTLNWLFTGGPPPAPPGPFNCGPDNGPSLGCNTSPPCSPGLLPGAPGLAYQWKPIPTIQGGPTGSWVCFDATAELLNNTSSPPLNLSAWTISESEEDEL